MGSGRAGDDDGVDRRIDEHRFPGFDRSVVKLRQPPGGDRVEIHDGLEAGFG